MSSTITPATTASTTGTSGTGREGGREMWIGSARGCGCGREREGGKKGCREEEVDWKWEGGSWSYTVSFIVPFDVADRF